MGLLNDSWLMPYKQSEIERRMLAQQLLMQQQLFNRFQINLNNNTIKQYKYHCKNNCGHGSDNLQIIKEHEKTCEVKE